MSFELNKEQVKARFLDPADNFREKIFSLEVRHDPLTGWASLIYSGMGYPPMNKPYMEELRKGSDTCPFCPGNIEKATPRFPEDIISGGNIRVNEAVVLPNIRPYSQYSGVVLLSKSHFIGLDEFTPGLVTDAFTAAQSFARQVVKHDPKACNLSIGWNYMAPAGATLSHPHIQVNLGIYPVPAQKSVGDPSEKYYREHGTNFWEELIDKEKKLDERYVGTIGSTCFLVSFAPLSRLFDLLAVFPGKSCFLDLDNADLRDLSTGLIRAFKDLREHGFYSFNLAVRSAPDCSEHFFCHARIISRFTFLSPGTCDRSFMEVLDNQMFSRISPEEVCRSLKKYF
ncbi:MAG: hypothetical protein U1D67_08715 [Dehalococcoidia bacterium]|nr:hypothetical protein [Dehalococcoidia bacterium]MDZ4247185.1 hypothetical protein [Dehalococcoidia bacterium]